MSVGETVKTLRLRKGLTQKELGARVGVSEAMICQIERGSRVLSLPVAKDMTAVLGCTLEELSGA